MQIFFMNKMTWVLIIFFILLIMFIDLIKSYFKSKKGKGQFGEFIVSLVLNKIGETYEVWNNITLIIDGESTQIDHIVISNKGIFIIETKYFQGLVLGQVKDAKWTQVAGRIKRQFQNPLRQNFRHTKFLAEKLGVEETVMIPMVCFTAEVQFPKGKPENVYFPREMAKKIKEYTEIKLDMNQIKSLKRQLQAMGATTSEKSKAHLENLKNRHKIQ